jgi:hypothetical protein
MSVAAGPTVARIATAGNAILVRATLNDRTTATLLVDTGATSTVITPALARRLDVTPPPNTSTRTAHVAGGRAIEVPFARLRSLAVGTAIVDDIEVAVYDALPHLRTVDGLLGADFFHHFRTSLDLQSRTLALEPIAPVVVAPLRVPLRALDAPIWRRGDEWAFRWDSPRGSGTYVWTVSGEDTVDGTSCYVITSGRRQLYYRKNDLAFVLEKLEGTIDWQARPPMQNFVWPLEPGRVWVERYTSERPLDRQTQTWAMGSTVEAEETITVPAGTFSTLKIVRRQRPSQALFSESWYAPDVKMAIQQREHLGDGIRIRQLTRYALQ